MVVCHAHRMTLYSRRDGAGELLACAVSLGNWGIDATYGSRSVLQEVVL